MNKDIPIEAKRIKVLREELGLTQGAFGEILGLKSSTVDIERGRTKLSGIVVKELMKLYEVNPLWLYGESIHKYIRPAGEDISPKVVTVDEIGTENIVMVNAKAAAGYPQNIQDVSWYEQLPCFQIPLPEYRNASYRVFQVEGDSMQPGILQDEWLVGRAEENLAHITEGKIYIIVLKDGVLVKRIFKKGDSQELILISDNAFYPPQPIPYADILEVWQVVSKLNSNLDEVGMESYMLKNISDSIADLKAEIKALKNQ